MSLEEYMRSQIANELDKSSNIKTYGKPTYDEITDGINNLTQAEFLAVLSDSLEKVLSEYFPPL